MRPSTALYEHGRIAGDQDDPNGFYALAREDGIQLDVQASDGAGWDHVSVSVANQDRTPTWEEMAWIREQFFRPSEWVIQFHPAKKDHVDYAENCLHLWRPHQYFPTPFTWMVGPVEGQELEQLTAMQQHRQASMTADAARVIARRLRRNRGK